MTAMAQTIKPLEILLVEDNPVDILVTTKAFSDGKLNAHLNVVEDGEEALDFLKRRSGYADAPVPDLILLDLNLPKKNGQEVLAEIKMDPALLAIPVVVLTSSQEQRDICASYDLHANCFITKPVDMEQFIDLVRSIEGFWFTVVKLPPPESGV